MNNVRSSEEVDVHIQERGDGKITVNVQLIGWTAQHFTSLPHNELLKSKIANKVALKVYDHYLQKSERGG